MANTKVTSRVLADNAVGITQLNVSDGSNGQVLTTNGSGTLSFTTISSASSLNDLSDVKTFGTSSIMIGDTTTGTIDAANYNTGVGVDIFAALTSGDNNVAIGFAALTANTTGNNNTATGYNSMVANTSGGENTAMGRLSLDANTTGSDNTAIGNAALSANTTASNNTALGSAALLANTTGEQNVAVGSTAMDATTTGGGNAAVGYGAMGQNTTGNTCTAVGQLALQANTTGNSNTAIGRRAMYTNTTAGFQTAVGYHSLYTCNGGLENVAVGANSVALTTTGSYNVGVGTNSLYDNTTGSYNVGIGYDALTNNTTATHNVAVGFRAGNGITTGGDIVVVGNYAGYTGIGTRSVAVGYSAGYNCTGSGNTLIGMNTGQGSYPLTSGSNCTMIGYLARPSGTLGNANNENVFGMNMSANGTNTTTLGAGGSGLYASHGSNSWTSISDERYKKDIVDSEVGLSFINDLRPRNFKWKTCGEVPDDTPRYEEDSDELLHPNLTGVMHGFIAQEVKAVIDNHSEVPNNQLIWKQDPDGIQGLAEGELVPALVKAIQELSAKNDALEARITELEG